MSFTSVHEQKLLSALAHVLPHITPPAQHSSSSNTRATAPSQPATPTVSIAPIPVRWPLSPPPITPASLLHSLTAHDLLCLLVHAVLLQHGAKLVHHQSDQQAASQKAAAATAAVSGAAVQSPSTTSSPPHYTFLPSDWNRSSVLVSLRYMFTTPISHPPAADSDSLSNAEVLVADSPIAYLLTLKCLPMAGFLVVAGQLFHVSPVSGEHSAVSTPYKLTMRCSDYVDLEAVATYVEKAAAPNSEKAESESDAEPAAALSVAVFRNVDRVMSGISNAIVKRCMGPLSDAAQRLSHRSSSACLPCAPLPDSVVIVCASAALCCRWTTFFAPFSPADNFMSPYLPDMPIDLLVSILVYLPSSSLARLSCASSAMHAAASAPFLWQLLCQSELPSSDRGDVSKQDWKAEFVIRRRLRQEEQARNRLALVPVGLPVAVAWDDDDRRRRAERERPFFPLPFPHPADVNDPLGLG